MHVELRGVTKRFGPSAALSEVDLAITAGTRIALLGPNGSGKTTLARAIMGLIRVDGEIRIDGTPLGDRSTVASRMTYVPQIAPQMAAGAGEIVRAICDLRGVRPAAVTDIAGELGLDLDAIRRRALRNLSGGMRHKLLLSLALAAPAELLVLDEPTASLDAAARARFLTRFAALDPGVTVVLCSHRLDELRTLVDHVVALAEGRIAYDGPADAYLARRLAAVIEVRYRGPDPSWLVAHDFARGVGGWWSRAITPAEKLVLVPAALQALTPGVDDVVVRDADRLEVGRDAA